MSVELKIKARGGDRVLYRGRECVIDAVQSHGDCMGFNTHYMVGFKHVGGEEIHSRVERRINFAYDIGSRVVCRESGKVGMVKKFVYHHHRSDNHPTVGYVLHGSDNTIYPEAAIEAHSPCGKIFTSRLSIGDRFHDGTVVEGISIIVTDRDFDFNYLVDGKLIKDPSPFAARNEHQILAKYRVGQMVVTGDGERQRISKCRIEIDRDKNETVSYETWDGKWYWQSELSPVLSCLPTVRERVMYDGLRSARFLDAPDRIVAFNGRACWQVYNLLPPTFTELWVKIYRPRVDDVIVARDPEDLGLAAVYRVGKCVGDETLELETIWVREKAD